MTGHGSGVEELRGRLAGRVSVLFGQSGVGKSTLVNQLVPDARRAVAEVSGVGKGRHTSSSAVALPLPGGGTVVDTPGVRSFGLGAVSPARVLAAFPDLAAAAEQCPPGCDHLAGTPRCALDAAVADRRGQRRPARLAAPAAGRGDRRRRGLIGLRDGTRRRCGSGWSRSCWPGPPARSAGDVTDRLLAVQAQDLRAARLVRARRAPPA